ncbi:predicted protein [Naegleria gruberi]|uniref:Predicted protein n=1 Tax=Naegleria gruberi TaxID=5762 RepID=D2VV12_NAEGR|nr:uncharacterized protein NAEGRDRAFT_52481 [Naegleria gruberi]EFC39415.1 predicted protein [Naegleria gruberi]|eukprot:XP_002672159.1 predicted protein [Naegleria gruberi strain NEG-M]
MQIKLFNNNSATGRGLRQRLSQMANSMFSKRNLLFIVLVIIYLMGGMMNNLGVQIMGYYMPLYNSGFLLYGTTFMYTSFFIVTEIFLSIVVQKHSFKQIKERWCLYYNKKLIICVLALGFFTAFNGIFAQSAIPFVDPELTAILTQVSAPLTWIMYPLILRKKYDLGQIGCFLLILSGLLFGSIYSYMNGTGSETTFSNSAFWLIISICSAIPTAFETIYQEVAYDSYKAPTFIVLVYYNLFSLIVYAAWMFMTMVPNFGSCNVPAHTPLSMCSMNATTCSATQVFEQQGEAFQCFFGNYDVSSCCGGWQATLWTCIFVAGYYVYFVSGSYLIEKFGSNVLANLNALLYPLTAVCFWIKPLVGQFSSQPTWWIIVSLIIITLGNIGYEVFARKPLYEMDPKFLPWNHLRHEVSEEKNQTKGGEPHSNVSINDSSEVIEPIIYHQSDDIVYNDNEGITSNNTNNLDNQQDEEEKEKYPLINHNNKN